MHPSSPKVTREILENKAAMNLANTDFSKVLYLTFEEHLRVIESLRPSLGLLNEIAH